MARSLGPSVVLGPRDRAGWGFQAPAVPWDRHGLSDLGGWVPRRQVAEAASKSMKHECPDILAKGTPWYQAGGGTEADGRSRALGTEITSTTGRPGLSMDQGGRTTKGDRVPGPTWQLVSARTRVADGPCFPIDHGVLDPMERGGWVPGRWRDRGTSSSRVCRWQGIMVAEPYWCLGENDDLDDEGARCEWDRGIKVVEAPVGHSFQRTGGPGSSIDRSRRGDAGAIKPRDQCGQ
jgi:hypothetical protein